MVIFFKHYIYLFLIIFFFILNGCQLQEPHKNHGIVFLENRSNKLKINESNKNDVINIFGQPHTISINNNNEWVYIERILTKGQYHKLGKTILKTNNILILNFDKYGILMSKKLFDKEAINQVNFSRDKTINKITQKSFVEKFLTSLKAKMYGNK